MNDMSSNGKILTSGRALKGARTVLDLVELWAVKQPRILMKDAWFNFQA